MTRMRPFILALPFALAACGLPRDSNGALERARGGVLRVGVANHPPWDSVTAESVSGLEPLMIQRLAATIGATPTWQRGSESELCSSDTDTGGAMDWRLRSSR